ncbi:sensor histidine kinase [Cytobacillus sp. Hm23]
MKNFNSITWKLGSVIIILFIIIAIPLVYVIDRLFTDFYYKQVHDNIHELSIRYASSLNNIQDETIIELLQQLSFLTNTEIIVVDENGQVIFSSLETVALIGGGDLSTDELSTLRDGYDTDIEYRNDNTHFLASGSPVFSNDLFLGGVFVLSSVDDIHKSISQVRSLLFIALLGAILIGIGITYFVTRKLSNPLLLMEKATREIAKGKLKTRVNVHSSDEIGKLSSAINDLATELDSFRTNRREFFANIAHELRTPLSYLHGYSQALKNNLYMDEHERNEYLSIIEVETTRLTRLVEDLFDLSKMELGKVDVYTEWVDIEEIVESAVYKTSIHAKKKDLLVKTFFNEHTPLIYSDGGKLEQLFINLLDNAIRYTNQGEIEVIVKTEPDKCLVDVKDTGIGIPEADIPFIFDRFYRVDKSRSRTMGGTGLGLAIVKNIIELLNGEVKVTSEINKGTTISISLPIEIERDSAS